MLSLSKLKQSYYEPPFLDIMDGMYCDINQEGSKEIIVWYKNDYIPVIHYQPSTSILIYTWSIIGYPMKKYLEINNDACLQINYIGVNQCLIYMLRIHLGITNIKIGCEL